MYVAEIYFDTEYSFQSFVLKKENIVVESDGLYLWIPLLHTHQCSFHVSYRDRQNSLQQILSYFSISQTENDALAALP